MRSTLSAFWEQLTGDPLTFRPENRAFNAISVITLLILAVLLPFNLYLGLMEISLLVAALLIVQAFFYYLSRFRKAFHISMTVYAVVSYLTLSVTYYYNSGSYGPALLLFFLTFSLLIAFSPRKQHWIWACLHLLLPLFLLAKEYLHPGWIGDAYDSREYRYVDILSSYVVTLTCMYLITNYLRNNYEREKRTADQRAGDLEALNQKKDKLFSIIAHDLQSPLNSIITTLHIFTEQELEEEEKTLMGSELLTLTRNTSNMLANLLTWSRMQMEFMTARPSSVQVRVLVERVLAIQRILAEKKDISVDVDVDAGIYVKADQIMLELIIRNLVNNAIKFTPAGGRIGIRLGSAGDKCLLIVEDTGIGIAAEQQEDIFSLKTQSTYGTNNEKGIGLGLVLCKELLALQGGELWFESEQGAGSTFYIAVPVDARAGRRQYA